VCAQVFNQLVAAINNVQAPGEKADKLAQLVELMLQYLCHAT
jgi:hypothetical protein